MQQQPPTNRKQCTISKLSVALIWPCFSSFYSEVVLSPVPAPHSNSVVTCFAVEEVSRGKNLKLEGSNSTLPTRPCMSIPTTNQFRCDAGSSKDWDTEYVNENNFDMCSEKKLQMHKDIDLPYESNEDEKPSTSTQRNIVEPVFIETDIAKPNKVFLGGAGVPSDGSAPSSNDINSAASHHTHESSAQTYEPTKEPTQFPSHTPGVSPSTQMQQLYWTKVPNNESNSKNSLWSLISSVLPNWMTKNRRDNGIWQEIEPSPLDNMNNFTELFEQEESASATASRQMKSPVLLGQRGINIAVLLHGIQEDFRNILYAIEELNADTLNLDALKSVQKLNATDEEIKLIQTAMYAGVPLTYAERCIFSLAEIPMYRERLSFVIFKREISRTTTNNLTKLAALMQVSKFLIYSMDLKKLFSIILTLGNRMNLNNPERGRAIGFTLDTLNKLKHIKSKTTDMNLLHFIVRSYIKCRLKERVPYEEIRVPAPLYGDVKYVCEISLEEVQAEIDEIAKQRENCLFIKRKIKLSTADKRSLTEFIADVKKSERKLQLRLIESREIFKKLKELFHFSSKTGTLQEFFEHWLDFTRDFQIIWEQEMDLLKHTKLEDDQLITEV